MCTRLNYWAVRQLRLAKAVWASSHVYNINTETTRIVMYSAKASYAY